MSLLYHTNEFIKCKLCIENRFTHSIYDDDFHEDLDSIFDSIDRHLFSITSRLKEFTKEEKEQSLKLVEVNIPLEYDFFKKMINLSGY
jgi:hypothetical protein